MPCYSARPIRCHHCTLVSSHGRAVTSAGAANVCWVLMLVILLPPSLMHLCIGSGVGYLPVRPAWQPALICVCITYSWE
jgi:hypothetical protein